MHIKDLKMDVELDGAALAAVRGGSSVLADYDMASTYPMLPTFDSDWSRYHTDVMGYIDSAKSEIPGYDSAPRPGTPEIAVPDIGMPVAL